MLTWVLTTLAIIILGGIVTSVVIVRALYKRIRRSRALTGTVLRARASFGWGPQHEVVKLRLRLKETLDSGQAAVDLAVRVDGPRGELPRLFRRIQREGATLESQLLLMTSERDLAVLAEEIPVVSRRVDEVGGLVRRLRSAVADGLGTLTDDTLTTLRSEVDREVAAVDAGVQELRSLNGHDGLSDSHRQLSMDHRTRGKAS